MQGLSNWIQARREKLRDFTRDLNVSIMIMRKFANTEFM